MVKKIILVFKTHFDIGFTDLSSKVIDKYSDSMLKDVIATCKGTAHMGRQKYVWTMPSWPLKVITERCSAKLKVELDALIESGQIVWHALPFTSHTDFCSAEEYIEGLRFGRELSKLYHKPYPISAKMTDVPGHGIMLPAILSGAGVKFLHLGCNEFAHPPKLPFLFHWQAISGERVLTMYSKGGYGTSLLPPEDWDYPVWMALMQTQDNCGPQSAEVIDGMIKKIHSKYPEAEVVCGTMDEFYYDLSKCNLESLPVVAKDLADTWIHGIGAYPKEVGMIREVREKSKRLQALITKKMLENPEYRDDGASEVLDKYFENINLFEEHTWGADVKTWLGPDRVYNKKDFIKAKQQENYQLMETSWQEQRDRAGQCLEDVQKLNLLVEKHNSREFSLFNPGGSEYTGWVSLKDFDLKYEELRLEVNKEALPITKIDGEWACFVKNVPPFITMPVSIVSSVSKTCNLNIETEQDVVKIQNHRYAITFSSLTGNVSELYDKKLNAALLKQQDGKSIFSYQYDRYGIEDITSYLRDYAYRFSAWGIQDYGREAYPECVHKTYHPTFKSYSINDDTITLCYENVESVERYGDAEEVQIEITLPPAGEELFVNVKLINKRETPYVESGSFLFPFEENVHHYNINKSNAVLDPSTDIQEDANHVFYCLDKYIASVGQSNGLCVIAKDTPLVSLGNPGVYKYKRNYVEPEEPIAYFNLFNNMWGTNFPQWIGGDFTFRYTLFGFEADQEASVMERAATLAEGIELTSNHLVKEIGKFPEHMQLINARQEEEGFIVRFKDLSGTEAQRTLQIKGFVITPVDFHNRVTGDSSVEKYNFQVKSYGIYSFLITRIDE
jgi:alpha-mannosidase